MAAEEMDSDDLSECSVELGMDYDRIEYPKEVYDAVCGRSANQKSLAKKQKVDGGLSASQSSQASSQLSQASSASDASSKARKRKQKQSSNNERKAGGSRKSVNTRRANVKKVKKEIFSDEDYVDDQEFIDDSSQVSDEAPKRKKKKDRLHDRSSGKSSKSGKTEKKSGTKIVKRKMKLRGRNVTMRREEESEESSEMDSEGEEESVDDGSEEESIARNIRKTGCPPQSAATKSSKAKSMDRTSLKDRGRKGEVTDEDYSEDSDEEEETIDSSPEKKKKKKDPVRVDKTEEKSRSINEKGKDDKTKRDTKKDEKPSSHDKWKEGKVRHDSKDVRVRRESHSNGEEKKESKEKERRSLEAKDSSREGRKSIDSTTQGVLPKTKHADKRPETTVPAPAQSSAVHPTRKGILKKSGPSTVNPSDNSMLPSCVQDIFNDLPCTPTNNFLDGFKVPKKKDKIEDRLTQRLGLPLTSPLAESPVQIEGSNGYNPRNDAFHPPQRTFGKPPLLRTPVGVERRQHDIHRRPDDKSPSAIASAFYRPSLFQREEKPIDQREFDDDDIDLEAIPIGAPPLIPLIPPSSPPRRRPMDDDEEEEEEQEGLLTRSPIYFATSPCREDSQEEYRGFGDWDQREHASPSYSMERGEGRGTVKHEFPTPASNEGKRWERDEAERKAQRSSSSSSFSTGRNFSSTSSFKFLDDFLDSSRDGSDKRADFSRGSAPPTRPSFREQELAEERRQGEERRRKREEREAEEEREREYWRMNTPLSPPPSASCSLNRRLSHDEDGRSTPTRIPADKLVRYRFIPIDDECLPPWNRSDRYAFVAAPAAYAPCPAPAPKAAHALLVAGPFPERVSKPKFEKMMKDRGADVEWTVAPATKDAHAMTQRAMAAIICYSEDTVKGLLEKHNIMIDQTYVEVGKPGEVLVSVEGFADKVDEKELTMEITDTVETHWGHLIELLLAVNHQDLIVQGKARFFYAVHASRASCAAPIPLSGGRLLSFAPCPPEKTTPWVTEIRSDSTEELNHHHHHHRHGDPRPVPPPVLPPTVSPAMAMAYVPPPDTPPTVAALSALLGTLTTPPQSQPSQDPTMAALAAAPFSGFLHTSRFSVGRPLMAIPPPGLVDPAQLKYMIKREEPDDYERTLSIPPIPLAPGSHIPLPPPPCAPIPPPQDIKPVLPYPDLPSVDRVFFQPPPPPGVVSRSGKGDRRMGGGKDGAGKPFKTATYLNHVKELLPTKQEEEEILLFARPRDGEHPADWDVVRDYFKGYDCSSLVYGGIVSLRFTGATAKEKAQLLLCEAGHHVNGQPFEVGVTFSVLFEATSAVRKIGVYDEVKERFGSVVEVEKKCNTPSGKPVYKIYFDSLETAKQAGLEGFTAEGSTFTNIGRLPE